jgi:hypothetical protein
MLPLCFMLAGPTLAAERYEAYDGPDILTVGNGGTKVERNGIEYWTLGMPHRPFKIIGVIKDSRTNQWWEGDPIGSKAIAKLARAANANAVIVIDSKTNFEGIQSTVSGWGSLESFFGVSSISALNRTYTRLLVVRYVNEAELAEFADKLVPEEKSMQFLTKTPLQNQKSSVSGPTKKVADTPSGYCLDVPRGYAGTGSISSPLVTSSMPACWSVYK